MNLVSILKFADKSVKTECHRKRIQVDDDLLQDVRFEVWQKSRYSDISRRLIATIARRRVVDRIRKIAGRSGKAPRSVRLTLRGWCKIPSNDAKEKNSATMEILDAIEVELAGDDKLIFRYTRQGFPVECIAAFLGISRNTAWKRRKEMIQKAKAIVRASGETN